MNIICGIFTQDAGEVQIFGEDHRKYYQRETKDIGYCPSYSMAYGSLTVKEQLRFVRSMKNLPEESSEQVEKYLQDFGLKEFEDTFISNLSGGNLRKMSLIEALIGNPRILILDEPTAGVDIITRETIWNNLKKIKQERDVCIVLTTHHLEEAENLSD